MLNTRKYTWFLAFRITHLEPVCPKLSSVCTKGDVCVETQLVLILIFVTVLIKARILFEEKLSTLFLCFTLNLLMLKFWQERRSYTLHTTLSVLSALGILGFSLNVCKFLSLNSETKICHSVKGLKPLPPSHLLCKRPACYHSASTTHVHCSLWENNFVVVENCSYC